MNKRCFGVFLFGAIVVITDLFTFKRVVFNKRSLRHGGIWVHSEAKMA